jgi:hypothetical protein
MSRQPIDTTLIYCSVLQGQLLDVRLIPGGHGGGLAGRTPLTHRENKEKKGSGVGSSLLLSMGVEPTNDYVYFP